MCPTFTRKYVLSEEIFTTGKTFTLPPAVTGVINIIFANVMSKKMMMTIKMTKIMMIATLLLMAMKALKILKRGQENIEDIEMRSRSGETPMLSRGE